MLKTNNNKNNETHFTFGNLYRAKYVWKIMQHDLKILGKNVTHKKSSKTHKSFVQDILNPVSQARLQFCLKVTLVNETVFCCCLVSNSIFGFANVSEIRLLCTDINKQTTHKHTIVYYLWVAHFDTLHIVMSHKSNSFRWLAENNESSESSPVHLFSVLFNAKFRIEKGVEADK